MNTSRQFSNLFVSSASPHNLSRSSHFTPFIKESQYFGNKDDFSTKNIHHLSSSFVKNNCQVDTNKQSFAKLNNSGVFDSNFNKRQNNVLERTKSQLIQPIYYFNSQRIECDSQNDSKDLGSSKISQITFSKPSEFITNSSNSNIYVNSNHFINSNNSTNSNSYINSSTKIVFSPAKNQQSVLVKRQQLPSKSSIRKTQQYIINSSKFTHQKYAQNNYTQQKINNSNIYVNDYGYNNQIKYDSHPNFVNHNSSINSMKQSYIIQNYHLPQTTTNYTSNHAFQHANRHFQSPKNYYENNFLPKQIINYQKPPTFTLKRALSNKTIMSKNSNASSGSIAKIKFNYISPTKTQCKTSRKLSFRKDDIKNPISKILNKKKNLSHQKHLKKQSQFKKQHLKKVQGNQVVNEYFPQFKIKNNKMKKNIISKNKLKDLSSKRQKFQTSNQASQATQSRRNTFIAGLQAFSQISEIKQQCESTQLSGDSAKKCNKMNDQILKAYEIKSQNQDYKRIQERKEIQNIENKSLKQKESDQSSQLSLNSIKNIDQGEYAKQGYESSNTTDYEDEIVKKIKNDLGLNFSYHKK